MELFRIWKGIVGKKGLKALTSFIEENKEFSYMEDDDNFTVFSSTKKIPPEMKEIFIKYKLDVYLIYNPDIYKKDDELDALMNGFNILKEQK